MIYHNRSSEIHRKELARVCFSASQTLLPWALGTLDQTNTRPHNYDVSFPKEKEQISTHNETFQNH